MAYEVHLRQFDGPLDLLLHLIEQAEVDIKDIFVSEITSQYLKYMKELSTLDMDTASEFLSMAATLVYIKSRSLLPKPPKEDDAEAEDPEEMLIRQLREYKLFKEAGLMLDELHKRNVGVFTKLPEEFLLPPQEINLEEGSVELLFNALLETLDKERISEQSRAEVHQVDADKYTIRIQLRHIRDILRERDTVGFEELLSENPQKMEMIVTFMALLDMIMRSEIRLHQKEPYGAITIRAYELIDDDETIEYMDE